MHLQQCDLPCTYNNVIYVTAYARLQAWAYERAEVTCLPLLVLRVRYGRGTGGFDYFIQRPWGRVPDPHYAAPFHIPASALPSFPIFYCLWKNSTDNRNYLIEQKMWGQTAKYRAPKA